MPSPTAAATATRYAVSAVASLTRLSPPRIVSTRRGSPSSRPTAAAATASGGATIAPSAKDAASGISGISQCVTKPTVTVVASTRPTERKPIGRRFALKLTYELSSAAE